MSHQRCGVSLKFWCLLTMLITITFIYNLTEVKLYLLPTQILLRNLGPGATAIEEATRGYLIKTPGCSIPEMPTMDASLKEYVFAERKIVCNRGLPPLFEANQTSLYLLPESLDHYKIKDVKGLKCCYQSFRRESPHSNQADKRVIFDEKCLHVANETRVHTNEEFLRLKCQYEGKDVYTDFFSFIPMKQVLNATSNHSHSERSPLSLLVLGIDGVSRLNFHRQMPRTAFYATRKLQGVEMLGYNKIGDNTFPNLLAVLTGKREDELADCWPNASAHFDTCDFAWRYFGEMGYVTAFGEDSAWMGMFNYNKRGFQQQPTDYFYDHFDLAATHEIGNSHRMNVDQCLGSRLVHKVFLDYIERFARTMHVHQRPSFAFFWSASLTHDFLNKPRLGDQDFVNLLLTLDEEGVLNRTALVLMSDHGIRWGSIRSTYQGRMEERLPFLFLILPQWFRDAFPSQVNNVKVNRRRLTTPFDLHETLLDMLYLDTAGNTKQSSSESKGISLFRTIPKTRTCEQAGIEAHWCTCQTSQKMDVAHEDIRGAVNFTITHIHRLLRGYAECVPLSLDAIVDARQMINDQLSKYKMSQMDMMVTFRTVPGHAVFEASVRKVFAGNASEFSLTGTISRINLYGQQSRCMSDFHLKLYCYCR